MLCTLDLCCSSSVCFQCSYYLLHACLHLIFCEKVIILVALEGKGCRLPLMKGEAELAEKWAAINRQLKGSEAELFRRVQNLLTISHVQANALGGGAVYFPGSTRTHEQSLADMLEQTAVIARLDNVLKQDFRDMEIIMAEEIEMEEG